MLSFHSASRLLAIAFVALFSHSAFAEEPSEPQDEVGAIPITEPVPEATPAPEPNTAILAAVGGLVVLLFAMRRK